MALEDKLENYYAVIMAGGGGTRLWPLSRATRPKQMLRLIGDASLFQIAVERLNGIFPPQNIYVVTVEEQAEILRKQCPELPIENFILEPMPRGTASVVGLAGITLQHRDPQAVMAILTADHYIGNIQRFHRLLLAAREVAQEGHLVTLGIEPTYPATGYGYIQSGKTIGNYNGLEVHRVIRFKEKPDEAQAIEMLESGNHAWNSGMFVWQVSDIMHEFERQMPELSAGLMEISSVWGTAQQSQVFGEIWSRLKSETIDFGIMENARDVAVIPASGLNWNDVGSWDSLFEMLPADADGNIILSGDHFGMDTRNSLVFGNEDRSRLIVTLGVQNLVIVDTENVLLVCSIEEAQRIREVVRQLKGERPEYLLRRYPLEAYCMKCKTKREMKDPQPVFTEQGVPATRAVCPVCGTTLYRMGRTEAHEGLPQPEKRKNREGKLVIVESPAKARTVGRFLGKGYTVKASVGHVRDLLRSQLSIDIDHDFQPKYRVPNDKRPVVKEIKKLAKSAEEIYLATDPDREGEAIAWHLLESAELNPRLTQRVVFHEITENAIEEAFSHPRQINMDLVDAQQARRVLDRLVGYNLSPLLWRKVRNRLSAGRVQSVALRLVVEREREIQAFIPEEYWSIAAELRPDGIKETFIAKLAKVDEQEPVLGSQADTQPLLDDMEKAKYSITKIKRGERRRKPSAPFTTSTLQQEASRRLGYTAKRTMALAQQLYEGVDLGEGSVGLITYMRTDSTNVAEQAQNEARQFIADRYGNSFLPPKPPIYQTKTRGAQEAHEAIRPTSALRQPETIKAFLNRDQFRLYQLIWQRFVASQMTSAIYNTVSVEVTGKTTDHAYLLRASGSSVKFIGFLVVYEEAKDEDIHTEEEEETKIPEGIAEGQLQHLVRLIPEQHFTQPPPRYSEASLVRTLEEYGIGRPSTYAPILSTIQQRGYVERDGKRLIPTETGFLVNDLITEHFPNIVDLGFTANMEEDLDRIASGDQPWIETIREFYHPFSKQVERAELVMPEVKTGPEPIGRECPQCGHELVIRWGRYGKFISCSNFPACRYTEALLEKIGVSCPKDGGDLVERKTRKGRTFFGCANYPACDFTSWKRPLPTPCPECGGLLVVANKDQAQCLSCEQTFLLDMVTIDETAEAAT